MNGNIGSHCGCWCTTCAPDSVLEISHGKAGLSPAPSVGRVEARCVTALGTTWLVLYCCVLCRCVVNLCVRALRTCAVLSHVGEGVVLIVATCPYSRCCVRSRAAACLSRQQVLYVLAGAVMHHRCLPQQQVLCWRGLDACAMLCASVAVVGGNGHACCCLVQQQLLAEVVLEAYLT